ncbi:amine oxidase [flavin-containing] A-like [Gigantopelta aegis]|uniref:amine oxidase [flavin-containing] A-like n=1 Tax=Gigantopelta aegis TaxID=1735272 RepID=UPI001B887DD6|nr:amine oxidase [flavin-containing] A-like [Gigantopelta aegis]XP_041370949.1 amine oxidase [flavin-containing] A-like [Gigantopelta aegis]
MSTQVVVVGAGISGLSAARLLQQSGIDVIVLEARNRLGGRSHTIQDPVHGSVDLGAAYIGPTQNRVLRLVKELGLRLYNVDEKGKSVLSLQSIWSTYTGTVPPLRNPIALVDLNHLLRTIDSMALKVPLDAPWTAEDALKWDFITLQEFVDSIAWTKAAVDIFTILVRSVLTSELHQVSLLFFLWFVHSGNGLVRLGSVTDGAQEKKLYGGAQQLSERMAMLLGDRVHLSCPVKTIVARDHDVFVGDSRGKEYKCQYVICAVPPIVLKNINFTPPLPERKMKLVHSVTMGATFKVNMFYKTAFWKDMGLCGQAISDSGPSGYCVDDTKPDGSHPSLLAFFVADNGQRMSRFSQDERKEALCEHFAKVFKCEKFLKPIGYIEKNWMDEEFSGGCCVCSFPPGVLTKCGRTLREPINRLHFAGTETATEWLGYMDGAIQAGERAAREVLHRLGLIKESDIWQSEPESLDHPARRLTLTWLERSLPSVSGFIQISLSLIVTTVACFVYKYLN